MLPMHDPLSPHVCASTLEAVGRPTGLSRMSILSILSISECEEKDIISVLCFIRNNVRIRIEIYSYLACTALVVYANRRLR